MAGKLIEPRTATKWHQFHRIRGRSGVNGEIRDKHLYEKVRGIATFETYCKERWDFSRQRAYQLIDSTKVIENVTELHISFKKSLTLKK